MERQCGTKALNGTISRDSVKSDNVIQGIFLPHADVDHFGLADQSNETKGNQWSRKMSAVE